MTIYKSLICIITLILSINIHAQDNWPQLRGPNARGIATNPDLPDTWSESKNILWKKDLPGRGWSSPVTWGDKLFITTVINDGQSAKPKKGLYFGGNQDKTPTTTHEWKVICLDINNGKILWQQSVHKGTPKNPLHIKNSYASETPIADENHIYTYFGNVGIFCFTHEGKKVWSKNFKPNKTRYDWGTAASPVIHKDRIYIINDNDEQSSSSSSLL